MLGNNTSQFVPVVNSCKLLLCFLLRSIVTTIRG